MSEAFLECAKTIVMRVESGVCSLVHSTEAHERLTISRPVLQVRSTSRAPEPAFKWADKQPARRLAQHMHHPPAPARNRTPPCERSFTFAGPLAQPLKPQIFTLPSTHSSKLPPPTKLRLLLYLRVALAVTTHELLATLLHTSFLPYANYNLYLLLCKCTRTVLCKTDSKSNYFTIKSVSNQ